MAYAFETDLFTPSYKMIKELYAFDKCNEENNLEKSQLIIVLGLRNSMV